MSTVKERIKDMVERLPEERARDLERLLVELGADVDAAGWNALATTAFASWFHEDEVEYTEDDLQNAG
jgi:hypothetical protein